MNDIKLLKLLSEIGVGQGYSKYIDGNTTQGNDKETLDSILKNIADGGIEYEDEINESSAPNMMFSVYNHIIDKLRSRAQETGLNMSIFEEAYPTASSFFADIEHLLK